jgi:RHS repeat-associated protein
VPAGSSEFPLPGVNAAKNWLNGSTYDQNGNVTTLNNATLSYDVENRLSEYTTGSFVENYAYDEANRRVDRWSGTTYDNVYFYGPNGKLLTVVQLNFNPTAPYVTASTLSNRIYFGKMLLGTTNGQVNTDSSLMKDRLGSVQPSYAYGTATGSGEQTSPGDDFATYWKDSSTGFEYAMNRYYSTGYGRFLTVDPFGGSARVGNPGSMNRYSYAGNDPVNRHDPSGLDDGDPTFYVTSTGEPDPSDDEGGPDVGDTDSLSDYCLTASWQPVCAGLNPFSLWQSGGRPGPVQNKGGVHTSPAAAAKVAWQYLNSVWQDCLNDFEQIQGFNATTFQSLLSNTPANGGITWLNDNDPSVANSTIASYGGTNTSTDPISSLFQGGADAYALPGTTDVVVGPDYFTNETQTQQIAIAIHEALHVALGQNDVQLYNTLSQFGFDYNPNVGSGQITDWIVGTKDQMSTTGGGCQNPPSQ